MYTKVYTLLEQKLGIQKNKLILPVNIELSDQECQQCSIQYEIGEATLIDIIKELQVPGRDPRDDLDPPVFAGNTMDIKDLAIGDELQGVVRNITDFGAFVDVGLHNDGLVHKSQLADRYVSHPLDVVSLGQSVKVRVLDIDIEREKISLTMRNNANMPSKSSFQKTSKPAKTIIQKKNQKQSTPSSMGGNISW